MARTKIFVSHIQENGAIAKGIKSFIDEKFLGAVSVFVSSDGDIAPGEDWQHRLVSEIRASDVMLVVCTNASIHRPWVNFEAGGALVRGARVIPVCWHGCKPALLPPPFSHLQALDLQQLSDVSDLMDTIAKHADMRTPSFVLDDLLARLPRRYSEHSDLAPSMFLGLDFAPPEGLRLEKEYGVKRRRTMVKPFRSLNVQIDPSSRATLLVEEEVVYFEHQDSRTLKVYLACHTDHDFAELHFEMEDAEVVGWQRHSSSVVSVEVRCNQRIKLLRPTRHRYSWTPPMSWGPDTDHVDVPIEQPTGHQLVEINSALPLVTARAFRDLQTTGDADEIAERALAATEFGCPPVRFEPPGSVMWSMELPEIQAEYRIVLYYAGGKFGVPRTSRPTP